MFSVILSIILKIVFDQEFIGEYKYTSRKKVNYYFIIVYCISTYFSLFFYILFWYYFSKIKGKKNKKDHFKYSTKLCGYIIYKESIKNEGIYCCTCCNCLEYCEDCELCCEDCNICCSTLNLSLCCYYCSCKSWCRGIFCCEFCNNVCDKSDLYRLRTMKDINKVEEVCIFYKVTGKWNWLGKIMTDRKTFPFVLILYYILITNMGFEDRIWDNIEKNNNSGGYDYLVNFVTIVAITFFYLINRFGGKCIIKFVDYVFNEGKSRFNKYLQKNFPGEYKNIFAGYFLYILLQTMLSIILSVLAYNKELKKIENYILSIPIGSVEYIKINILEIISFFVETNYRSLEFFSNSTIFSVYLLFWNIIIFILNVLDANNDVIIFIQYIIGSVVVVIISLIFIIIAIVKIWHKYLKS